MNYWINVCNEEHKYEVDFFEGVLTRCPKPPRTISDGRENLNEQISNYLIAMFISMKCEDSCIINELL